MNTTSRNTQMYFLVYPFKEIRSAYPSLIIRIYCLIRAHILRQRLLAEVGQYVPMRGAIAEFGCGFGLFSLCFAKTRPDIDLYACDLSEGRVRIAQEVAQRLGVTNCRFKSGDAADLVLELGPLSCAYMFDLIHHMPRSVVPRFLHQVWSKIEPGGVLLVKDVDNKPFHKMAFTYLLDVLMTKGERPDYWSSFELATLLHDLGGEVHVHALDDYLPFPHQLYVVRKPPAE